MTLISVKVADHVKVHFTPDHHAISVKKLTTGSEPLE